jgi:membrane fusion protein
MNVLLRYQAYPYQKFGQFPGSIREVSGTPVTGAEFGSSAPPAINAEPVYRVRVSLNSQTALVYGETRRLVPGMALEASVLLERRHLYEWILEPLYSIKGKL